jgi:hypothetical protein
MDALQITPLSLFHFALPSSTPNAMLVSSDGKRIFVTYKSDQRITILANSQQPFSFQYFTPYRYESGKSTEKSVERKDINTNFLIRTTDLIPQKPSLEIEKDVSDLSK